MGGVVSYCAGGVILAWGTVGGGLPRVKLAVTVTTATEKILEDFRLDTRGKQRDRLGWLEVLCFGP